MLILLVAVVAFVTEFLVLAVLTARRACRHAALRGLAVLAGLPALAAAAGALVPGLVPGDPGTGSPARGEAALVAAAMTLILATVAGVFLVARAAVPRAEP